FGQKSTGTPQRSSGNLGNAGVGGESFGEQSYNPREDYNRQDEKLGFLERNRNSETHLTNGLTSPRSKYELMAGSIVPGLMLTGINSDLPGNIVGQVSQNIFDTVTGRHLLLPQG